LNTLPSTVNVGGHGAGVPALSPAVSNAVDVITLNVEPGGYEPSSARENPLSGFDTYARIRPVAVSTATSAALPAWPASAESAACWVAGSSVTCTGSGVLPGKRFTVPTTFVPSSIVTRPLGRPASRCSNASCSPPSPTWSPTRYGGPSCLSRSAVISPTRPMSCSPMSPAGASTPVLCWKNTPLIGASTGRSWSW
jgi:hypothetical protein